MRTTCPFEDSWPKSNLEQSCLYSWHEPEELTGSMN